MVTNEGGIYLPYDTQQRKAVFILCQRKLQAYQRRRRNIVGQHVSDDMKVSSAVVTLKKAMAQKPVEKIVIQHSYRGVQYCSHKHVNLLDQNHAMLSLTQSGDPLENAVAERKNSIFKTELISSYEDIDKASLIIGRANYLQF